MDNSFLIKLGLDTQQVVDGVKKTNSTLSEFGDQVKSIGRTIASSFAVQQVATFAIEMTKLAGQVDGVRQAFSKLADSQMILVQMRESTRGTVSDLDLMKSAVQASNFGIPIQQLGTLFEFANERAKATGQSVDYLVESITTGIGRKSPLILDNLGISAVQLKEKLNGVSTEAATVGQVAEAVGAIASEAMNKAGKSADTAADQIARIGATWENVKEKMGGGIAALIGGDDHNALLTNFSNQLTVWGDKETSVWRKVFSSAKEYAEIVKEIEARQIMAAARAGLQSPADLKGMLSTSAWADNFSLLEKMNEALKKGPNDPVGVIQQIKDRIKELGEARDKTFGPNALSQVAAYNKEMETLKGTMEALTKMGTGPQDLAKINGGGINGGSVPTMAGMAGSFGNILDGGPLGSLGGSMRDAIDAMEKAEDRAKKFSNTLKGGLIKSLADVSKGLGEMMAGMNTNLGATILDNLGRTAVELGTLLIATGVGVESFKTSLSTLNGAAAIAAGATLVAAGGAFMALASSFGSSGGGGQSPAGVRMDRPIDVARSWTFKHEGELVARGSDLVYVFDKQGYTSSLVGG